MQIDEKTRINFSGEKAIVIIAFVITAVWAVHNHLSEQNKRDEEQDARLAKHDILLEEQRKQNEDIEDKLDQIILNQSQDHNLIIKHEYTNMNKAYNREK